MASKKKDPRDTFENLIDALDSAYDERSNTASSFDEALEALSDAFDNVMHHLQDPY